MSRAQPLTQSDIDGLETRIVQVLSQVESKKHGITSYDFNQLNNHLQMCLTVFRNIRNNLTVQASDTYGGYNQNYTGIGQSPKIFYNTDGTTKIVNGNTPETTNEEWEKQFDQSLLINPPCFIVPPQNITSVPRLRQAAGNPGSHYFETSRK
jgi:hypothetical protein